MMLTDASEGSEYTIKQISLEDKELLSFLFSLGLYNGEAITVISRGKGCFTISVRDGRYSIDSEIAMAIEI